MSGVFELFLRIFYLKQMELLNAAASMSYLRRSLRRVIQPVVSSVPDPAVTRTSLWQETVE